jgi:hypothetical protein
MNGKFFSLFALLAAVGCSRGALPQPAVAEPFTAGEQLLEAMQNRYVGRWYRTLTFVQETSEFPAAAPARTSLWYEALLLPSQLRIDFEPLGAGHGVIVRADSQYVIQNGAVTQRIARTNELLLLGFDVYFLEPSVTANWLRRLGFDLSRIRLDQWQGREVYVVGASSADDLRSPQFWVDREQLLFVRLLQPTPLSGRLRDVRFLNYEEFGRAWVAPLVEMYEDGRLVLRERYRHVRVNAELDSALFDPGRFTTARHWYEERR